MPTWFDGKVVLALFSLAIAAGAFFWNWRRTRKKLSYADWSSPLIRHVKGQDLSGRLVLLLDGAEIRNVSQVTIRIINTGWIPIERKDFDSSIRIVFENLGEAVSKAFVNSNPSDLAIDFLEGTGETPKSISVVPMLLNPGDEFTIYALVRDYSGFNIYARVSGLKKLTELSAEYSRNCFVYQYLFAAVWLVIVLALIYFGSSYYHVARATPKP